MTCGGPGCQMERTWLYNMGDGKDMVVGYWGWSGHGCINWGMKGRGFNLCWSRM